MSAVTCVQIEVEGVKVYLILEKDTIQLVFNTPYDPVLTITGPLSAFVLFALTKNARKAAQAGLRIEGDMSVAERVQDRILDLNMDWEEWLSQWIGDNAAYRLGSLVRSTQEMSQASLKHLSKQSCDYIEREQLTPTVSEITSFLQAVDTLQADSDRLEARLMILESR